MPSPLADLKTAHASVQRALSPGAPAGQQRKQLAQALRALDRALAKLSPRGQRGGADDANQARVLHGRADVAGQRGVLMSASGDVMATPSPLDASWPKNYREQLSAPNPFSSGSEVSPLTTNGLGAGTLVKLVPPMAGGGRGRGRGRRRP